MTAQSMLFMANGIEKEEWFYLIASFLLLVAAIVLVVIILIQSNSSKGLSGAIAGGSEPFYGRNKGKSIDKKLMIVTIAVPVAFAILTLAVFSIQTNSKTLQDWWNDLIGSNTSTNTSTDTEINEEDVNKDTSTDTATDTSSADVTE